MTTPQDRVAKAIHAQNSPNLYDGTCLHVIDAKAAIDALRVPDKTRNDAPDYYETVRASAWANGYNQAIRDILGEME